MKENKKNYNKITNKYICTILGVALYTLLAMLPARIVSAASANIYFETEYHNASVGDEISVYLYVDTDITLGDFEGYISYNPDILEFKSGPSCITGGDGTLKVYDYGTSSTQPRKYMMIFKVIDIGYVQFDVIGEPVAYDYESGDAMSVSSMAYGISTVAAASASENALLESLKIVPGTLTPSFDPSIYEYNTIVDTDATNLIVSALPQDFSSKVSVKGNQNLNIGSNEVTIEVTAAAGNVQKYVINVIKEEKTDKSEEPEEPKAPDLEWRFEAVEESGNIKIAGQYFYTVAKDNGAVTIPEGFEKRDFVLDGFNIPAYQEEGNDQSDYFLLVLTNEAGETGLYRYDRLEKTIQRYFDDNIIITSPTSDQEEIQELSSLVRDYKQNLNQLGLVIALLCGFSGILIIGLIRFYLKAKGMKDDELD